MTNNIKDKLDFHVSPHPLTDETGTYYIYVRDMPEEEVALLSAEALAFGLSEGSIVSGPDGKYGRRFRHYVSAQQKSSSDAVPFPEDMSAESARVASLQVKTYQDMAISGPVIAPPTENTNETRGLQGLGLNTEDAHRAPPAQALNEEALKFPRNVSSTISFMSKIAEENRTEAAGTLLNIITASKAREWATRQDIEWGRELTADILKALTDVSERRIPELATALSEALIYGFLRRKFGTGIQISAEELANISAAFDAQKFNEEPGAVPQEVQQDL